MQGGFDIGRLLIAAQNRWLKPSEVFFILQNHEKCSISPEIPHKPPSGSVFLVNRRVLRYYRKDGHVWRKKKDGRTGEGHEKLKVGAIDALNCYYAHGQHNPYFQRRCYWILDPSYDHIVLVHYREVFEGRSISEETLTPDPSTSFGFNNSQNAGITAGSSEVCVPHNLILSSPGYVEEVSSENFVENDMKTYLDMDNGSGNSNKSSQTNFNEEIHKLEVQLGLGDDENNQFPSQRMHNSGLLGFEEMDNSNGTLGTPLHGLELCTANCYHELVADGQDDFRRNPLQKTSGDNMKQYVHSLGPDYNTERSESASWKGMVYFSNVNEIYEGMVPEELMLGGDLESASRDKYAFADIDHHENDLLSLENGHPTKQLENFDRQLLHCKDRSINCSLQSRLCEASDFLLDSYTHFEPLISGAVIVGTSSTSSAIEGTDYTSNHISSTGAKSMIEILDKENDNEWMGVMHKADSYSSGHYVSWSDQNQCTPKLGAELTVADKQQFSIRKISPEWAFCTESSKVIITGDFLSDPSEVSWAVMFGDMQVPAEIVQNGVLRCHAPKHVPGKVTLCVTSGNRQPCSEVKEFEYLAKPETVSGSYTLEINGIKKSDELLLLLRFTEILLDASACTSIQKENPETEIDLFGKLKGNHGQWEQITSTILSGNEDTTSIIGWLLEELLKDKFQFFLSSKHQKDEVTGCFLTQKEQCMIHMISGLGYEWALNPLLNSGVGINFRDDKGWTALHWAAWFGREKMVASLLAAGASPGAVTDPTPQDLLGRTPASLSESSGFKGLAGYLSEVALTTHLSSLMLERSESSLESATVEAEIAVDRISEKAKEKESCQIEKQLSLADSLEAVRNSVLAAACIQLTFRAHSFRKKQQKDVTGCDGGCLAPDDFCGLSVASRSSSGGQRMRGAALSIQKNYRCWKGRKDFLTLRQNVVKIQAHVRGHQVRKKYKEILWTVGVVEKAVLRWRRKEVGLRGFHPQHEEMGDIDEDVLKAFRQIKVDGALKEAVSRVLSMAESPKARKQYSRVLESYLQAKVELWSASEARSNTSENMDRNDENIMRAWEDWLNSE